MTGKLNWLFGACKVDTDQAPVGLRSLPLIFELPAHPNNGSWKLALRSLDRRSSYPVFVDQPADKNPTPELDFTHTSHSEVGGVKDSGQGLYLGGDTPGGRVANQLLPAALLLLSLMQVLLLVCITVSAMMVVN